MTIKYLLMTKIILPNEIIDHILSFSPGHRNKLRPSLQQLEDIYFKRKAKKIRRQYIDTDLHNHVIILNNIGLTELHRWYEKESSIIFQHPILLSIDKILDYYNMLD